MKTQQESKKYKLTTIRDIFEKVPAEKIETCMKELTVMLVEAKLMNNMLSVSNEVITGNKVDTVIEWPEPVEWIDDGKGEIKGEYYIHGEDKPFMKTETEVKNHE